MLQKITKIAKTGLILLFCIILSSKNYAQTPVQADPALAGFNILSNSNAQVDANALTNNTFYLLDLVFQNNYFS